MKKIKFKNLFTKRVSDDLGSAVAWPVHYVRDWKIIVLCFAVGLISLSLFAWRIYLSNQIAGGYLTPVIDTSDTYIKTLNNKRLEADLLLLENKQTDYLKLKATAPKLVDPSL